MSISEPNRRVVVVGGALTLAGIRSASAQTSAGNDKSRYHIVYTANTGCFGPDGTDGRHSLGNMVKLNAQVPVDYINTNFWSDDDRGRTPVDFDRNPVPGTQIAYVSRGGNDRTSGSDLGKNLFRKYNLGPVSEDVVLVYVNDPADRKQDRVVERFASTSKKSFVDDVLAAIEKDRLQQQGRGGMQR